MNLEPLDDPDQGREIGVAPELVKEVVGNVMATVKESESYSRGFKEGIRIERERVLRLILVLTAGGFSEGHDAQRTLKILESDVRQGEKGSHGR